VYSIPSLYTTVHKEGEHAEIPNTHKHETPSRSLNLKFEVTHVRCPGLWWNITVFSSRPQSLETLECCLYSSLGHLQTPGFPGGMCPLISLGIAGFRCHLYFQRILFPFVYVLCMHMREGVFLLCL